MGLALALVLTGPMKDSFPPVPPAVYGLLFLLLAELVHGALFGLIGRMLLSSMHVAGTIIAFQTGLAAAQNFDPSQGNQTALVASMMTIFGVTMMVVLDLHLDIIRAAVYSYTLFPAGTIMPIDDFARVAIHYVSYSFLIGFQIALPFIIYAVVYNVGLGVVARLVPRIQVFFVSLPLNIMVGLSLVMVLLPSILLFYVDRFRMMLENYLG